MAQCPKRTAAFCLHTQYTHRNTHPTLQDEGIRSQKDLSSNIASVTCQMCMGGRKREDRYSTLFVIFFSILKENALWDLIFPISQQGKHDSRNGFICHSFMSFYSLLTNLSLLSASSLKKDIHVLWVNGIEMILVPPQHPSSVLLCFL